MRQIGARRCVLVDGPPGKDKRSAHARTSRLIFAFFHTADAGAQRVLKAIGKKGVRARLIRDDTAQSPPGNRFDSMRLKGEQLLIAEVSAETAQPLVEEIRREQPERTFVIPEVFTEPSELPAIEIER